jgi:hypothetical protein
MNGSIKGLNIGLLYGESLRPDVALLDDPQDEQTADSTVLIKKVIKKIDYGIRSLAGPRRRLTVMAAVTCVTIGDVSEHLLTRPGTEVIITGQITHWPKGWTEKDSTIRAMWDEWNTERLHGLQNLDGGKRARSFYKANKPALIEGMAVSWSERYHQSDGLRVGDPDELFAAMWDFYELGENAFMAERQNTPIKEGTTVYNIKAKNIIEKTTDRSAGEVPSDVSQTVLAIDVNPSLGLTWGVIGFGASIAHVIEYGRVPLALSKDVPEQELGRLVYESIVSHVKALSTQRQYRISIAGFDIRGWNYQTAYNLSAIGTRATGVQMIGTMGFGSRQYKPRYKSGGRSGGYWHEVIDDKRRKYIAYCSCFWREVAQKAWLGSIGSPGSCDLPKGKHDEFAEQICREPLLSKTDTTMGVRWEYATLPGAHDMGDVMQIAYMLADHQGAGTGGITVRKKNTIENRRCKVALSENPC